MDRNKIQKDVMRIEAEIDAKRDAQSRLLLAAVREIQDRRGERPEFEIEMVHDPVDGYRASIKNRVGMFADVADEIDDLLCDYSFVFAGKYGVATVGPKTETIRFET
jgi:hypothetical protein